MLSKIRTYLREMMLMCSILLLAPTYAQWSGAGSSTFAFLDMPFSSRLNALGGTNVALQDGDISMAFANPALLCPATDKVLQLNYAYLMDGTMLGSAMYGHNFGPSSIEKKSPIDKPNFFAVGLHYLDHGQMPYADEYGNLTGGTFTAKDILIQLMYARQLGQTFSIGVALKPILSFYESYSSVALGMDIGGHYHTPDSSLHLGLALRNVGWQLKGFYDEYGFQHREMLPLNLELGINYRLKHAPLRFGMTIHNLQRWDLSYPTASQDLGGQVKWYDMLFRHTIFSLDIIPKSERFYLTLSYNHRRRAEMQLADQRSLAGFALGGGVRIYKLRLGFAFSQLTKSSYVYQASLSFDIQSMLK